MDLNRSAGRSVLVLLDETQLRIESDGRWTQRSRQVVQLLDASAVRQVAERAFSYARDHQSLRLDWVRVLRPSGQVVSDRPAQDQEGDVAAALNNPVYSDQRVRRISLAGVAEGLIVDVQFTVDERAPRRAGDVFVQWALNGPVPIRRSRLDIDVPASFAPRLVERNLVTRRTDELVGDRRRLVWSTSDQDPVPAEPFAADSNDVQQFVTVSAAATWDNLAMWYDGLARARYALSPAVIRVADSVLVAQRVRTRADTIRAWHRWIAQDVRYLSVALGMGSYQPRTADEMLQAGAGDCKDKATLFVALLRRAGIEAAPVLLNTNGRLVVGAPSVMQFNHAIAAVREGTGWTFTDLTAGLVPYGAIPDAYQSGKGLLVTRDGRGTVVDFPAVSAADAVASLRLRYALSAAGVADGSAVERAAGPGEWVARSMFAAPLDATRRAALTRQIAQRVVGTDGGVDARVDSLTAFDGHDLRATPEMRYNVHVEGAARDVGSTRVLAIPMAMRGPARQFRTAAKELEQAGPRRLPIDGARIIPPMTTELEWVVTLPEGWAADLPAPVTTSTFFGRYESRWTLQGRELRLLRRLVGQRGVVGAERMVEVLVWLRAVGADDQEFLTLKPVATKVPEGAH
jgi:transglutaminase-like putative cysteine protease